MGAEASRSGSSAGRKGSGALAAAPRRSKSSLIAKWQKRQLSTQIFAVVRHAERADGIYAFVDGTRWTITEDFRRWPLDPPLSDVGLDQAKEMGHFLEDYAEQQDSVMHVVISSPYFRCIQTAVLICSSLGPGARLLVDRSLGEVYGPSVMGSTEPCNPVRDIGQTNAYCNLHGVSCQSRVIGRWPTWPEQLRDARRRYALRFFSYLQRSVTTRRNFILVAHGDAVGAVLSTMPSLMHQVVEKVEYGGLFVARRTRTDKPQKEKRKSSTCSSSRSSMTSVLPATAEEAGVDGLEQGADFDMAEVDMRQGRPIMQGNWMEEAGLPEDMLHTPKASESWDVDLHGITMREREGEAKFQRRLRSLAAQSELSSKKIERLLGELGDQPLGDDAQQAQSIPGRSHTDRMVPSCCSVSTYLFGASDAGGERDLGSRDLDLYSEASDGRSDRGDLLTSLSLASQETDSPLRHGRAPSHSRLSAPGSPRLRASRSHRRGSGRAASANEGPQRAATLHALLERSAQLPEEEQSAPAAPPPRAAVGRLEEPSASVEGCRRSATTLLPVMELQAPSPEPKKGLGGMENSLLMRRRRLQTDAQRAEAASPDAAAVRLLPSHATSSDLADIIQTALEKDRPKASAPGRSWARSGSRARSGSLSSPSTPPSPLSPGSPGSPGRSEEAAGPSQSSQGGRREAPAPTAPAKAAVVFKGLDGSALLQRRRQGRAA